MTEQPIKVKCDKCGSVYFVSQPATGNRLSGSVQLV
jgi:uncharacterized OB-fold protein